MVFSSTTFLFLFLPVCLILYYLLPGKTAKNIVLLVFSLLFYAWGEPVYIILMLLSIGFNFFMGLFMDKVPEWKKAILILSVIVNIGLLMFFKYYGLFVDTFNQVTGLKVQAHALALPIGISFYTFQTLSYIIDLYRGKIKVQKNIILFGAYISMFPQLIAGPIVRYEDVENDLNDRKITMEGLGKGMALFVFGLAKKVLLANVLGIVFESTGMTAGSTSVLTSWVGLIAYGLQIYFDFSGYSDMAIGLGLMLGFRFPENFNSPYASFSVTEFWRRWHMTLGTWFREYVYIPLGGNRKGVVRHILNILIVWMLTGFWHGAAWNFLLWGLYYGVILLVEKYVVSKWKTMPKALGILRTLIVVFLGWGLFLCTSFTEVKTVFGNLFGFTATSFADKNAWFTLASYAVILVISALMCVPAAKKIRDRLIEKEHGILIAVTIVLFLLSVVLLVTENYNPFLYFRF